MIRIWRRFGVVALAATLSLALYAVTLAPDLTWSHWGADGGDFVTAALTGRVPHPPGAPVYMLLADIFVRLPWGTPAWRLNLLSAVMGAGAVTGVTATLLRSTRESGAALVAGLALACAPLFWSQALITEVTTTAAFFAAWALFLAAGPAPGEDSPGRALAAGLVWGLGVAVHPILVFLAPVLGGRWRGKARGLLVAGFFSGLLPYVLLPLRGTWPQPWADMSSLAGWWDFVSARLYQGYVFGLPWAAWPRRGLAAATLLARQFTPVGALLALWGGYCLWERKPRVAVGMALAVIGVGFYAVGYNTADSLVYFVPFLPLAALWLGEGLAGSFCGSVRRPATAKGGAFCGSVRRPATAKGGSFCGSVSVSFGRKAQMRPATAREVAGRGIPAAVWLLLPALSLLWHWPALDLSHDWTARRWLERTLAEAPPDAVLVTSQDAHTFALWYAQAGLGLRPDVSVVDRDLWGEEVSPEEWAEGRPWCYVEAESLVCP